MIGWIVFAGVAVALAGYTAVAAVAALRLSRPRRRHPNSAPGAIGLAYQNIEFPARGEALAIAAWHIPAAGAARAVIIAHGLHRCRGREFTVSSLELVEHLVSSGFAVLMLDLRGHGASGAARLTYGVREQRDVLGAVDWLLAHGYAPGAIGVLGASMGGVAAIGAAAEEPAIGALILDSAYADFAAMMRILFQRFSKLPLVFLPGTLLLVRLLTGEDMQRLRPAERLRASAGHRPVLIFHAGGDKLVPVSHAHALATAGDADLWLTPSAGHLGAFGADPHAYSQRVIRFFQRALADTSAPHAVDDDAGDAEEVTRSATDTPLIR